MGEDNTKVVAVLSYFLIGIIWFFVDDKMKKNAFVKFHVKQALNLIIISIVVNIVFSMLFYVYMLWTLVRLAIFVLLIIGIIYAAQGKKEPVPIVGSFAESYLTF